MFSDAYYYYSCTSCSLLHCLSCVFFLFCLFISFLRSVSKRRVFVFFHCLSSWYCITDWEWYFNSRNYLMFAVLFLLDSDPFCLLNCCYNSSLKRIIITKMPPNYTIIILSWLIKLQSDWNITTSQLAWGFVAVVTAVLSFIIIFPSLDTTLSQ